MRTILHDLWHAFRMMRKAPAFSAGVIATVALAVGANAAIFSVAQGVLLRQLPFAHPERLVWMWSRQTVREKGPFNICDFIDYRDGNRVFEHVSAMQVWNPALTTSGQPERLQGLQVSSDLFETLGASAAIGRTLVPEDDRPGAMKVAVLTHGLWLRRFGGDPRIVGTRVLLDGEPLSVVGVLPPSFFFPMRDVEFAAPLAPDASPLRGVRASVSRLRVVGRLRPGVSLETARDSLSAIAGRLQHDYPATNARKVAITLVPIADEIVGSYRAALFALLAAVVGVLVIACANLANLTLARGSARGTEIATRLALGATRSRLTVQLLTESMLLAVLGGGAGLAAAKAGVQGLLAFAPADLPRMDEIAVDGTVLLFTLAATMLAGLFFGLVPAFLVSRADLNHALRDGGRGSSEGRDRRRARSGLVMTEVALAVVLSIVVGLFARSFANIEAVATGFDPSGAATVQVALPTSRYATRESIQVYQHRALADVLSLPALESAGAVSYLPLSGLFARVDFTIEGIATDRDRVPTAHYRLVTPGYLRAMRIPVLRGRGFTEHDNATAPNVALVNRSLAARFLAGRDPLGARILVNDNDTGPRPLTIVGVVGDVRQISLDGPSTFDVYLPYDQLHPDAMAFAGGMFWVVRGRGGRSVPLDAARDALRKADPAVPVADLRPVEQWVSAAVAPRRFNLRILLVFAAAALLLSGTGIYAMLSYSVSQRTREFAIRAALGAGPGRLLALVLGQGLAPALAGIVLGLAAAFGIARMVSSMLFNVSPTDPATLTIVTLGLLAVTLASCLIPGLRAARAASDRAGAPML